MLRLVLYIALFFLAIYFIYWLIGKYKRLPPQTKKAIIGFGLPWIFRLLRYKWRSILGFLLKLLRR